MQRPISGLSPNQTSPSQTTKILPRSNIQMSPETIINIDHNQQFPTRAESIQSTSQNTKIKTYTVQILKRHSTLQSKIILLELKSKTNIQLYLHIYTILELQYNKLISLYLCPQSQQSSPLQSPLILQLTKLLFKKVITKIVN